MGGIEDERDREGSGSCYGRAGMCARLGTEAGKPPYEDSSFPKEKKVPDAQRVAEGNSAFALDLYGKKDEGPGEQERLHGAFKSLLEALNGRQKRAALSLPSPTRCGARKAFPGSWSASK